MKSGTSCPSNLIWTVVEGTFSPLSFLWTKRASVIGHLRLVDENLIISSIEISSGILQMIPSRETRKLGMKSSRLKLERASLVETDFSIRLM